MSYDHSNSTETFVMTETAENILSSLNMLSKLDSALATLISGAPGVGKSHAVKHFLSNTHNAKMITVHAGEGCERGISGHLLSVFAGWQENNISLSARRECLLFKAIKPRIIVFDEAQNFTDKGAEWVRGLCEEAGMKFVFVGDLRIKTMLARLPQLARRMRRPVVVKAVTEQDVIRVLNHHGVNNAQISKALFKASQSLGGLGSVTNVVEHAQMFAGGGKVEPDHIRSALIAEDMSHALEV